MAKRLANGRFAKSDKTALERFKEKCEFNPVTGCVIWKGARTRGQGKTRWYGRFWDGKKHVLAHRWAAEHIHGLDLSDPDTQVDHCCPCGPDTLCVEHLQTATGAQNLAYYWIRVEVGLYEDHPQQESLEPLINIPWYSEPEWLK